MEKPPDRSEQPLQAAIGPTSGGAARHSAVLVAAVVTIAILNYAFGVVMSWFFDPAQYGVLGVSQSLLLLTALVVGSGFAWTTAHDMAAAGVTGETRRRFRAAWLANLALGLCLALGLWAAYGLGWLPLGPAYRAVVPLVGLTTVLLAARAVVNGAMRGQYRFGSLGANLVGEVGVKAGAGLALVAAGSGVAGVLVGFALGTAAALAHSLWVMRPARLWHGRGWLDRGLLAATLPLFVGMLGTALMLNLDILGLKLLSPAGQGDELAGFYQAAIILARTPVFVAQSLTLVLFSYIAGTNGSRPRENRTTTDYMQAALRVWLRLLLPAGLVLMLAPQLTLSLFFPPEYQTVAPALQVAAAGGVLLALVTLLTAVFQAAGDRRRPAMAAAVATSVQIAVLVWLVPQWGTLGAAASLLAAGAVALIGLAPAFRTHLASLRPADRGTLPRALFRGLLPLAALAVPLLVLPDGGRGAALAKLLLASLSYLAVLAITHPGPSGRSRRPVTSLFSHFVQMLMGG